MNDFLFARSQMAMSLGFHIIFAVLGIGLPLLICLGIGAFVLIPSLGYLFYIFKRPHIANPIN